MPARTHALRPVHRTHVHKMATQPLCGSHDNNTLTAQHCMPHIHTHTHYALDAHLATRMACFSSQHPIASTAHPRTHLVHTSSSAAATRPVAAAASVRPSASASSCASTSRYGGGAGWTTQHRAHSHTKQYVASRCSRRRRTLIIASVYECVSSSPSRMSRSARKHCNATTKAIAAAGTTKTAVRTRHGSDNEALAAGEQ